MGMLMILDISAIALKKEFSNSLVDYFRYLVKIGKQDDASFYNKFLNNYQPTRMSRKLSGFFTDVRQPGEYKGKKSKSKQKNNRMN